MAISYFSAPPAAQAKGMAEMGVTYEPPRFNTGTRQTPGEWLEYSPLLTIVVCALGLGYMVREVATAGPGIILDLNHYVFLFLIVGPAAALAAAIVRAGDRRRHHAGGRRADPVSDLRGHRADDDRGGLAAKLAHFFVTISTRDTYPVMIGIYSAFLGLFIPSAGGKWLIEAPYMLEAAKSLEVHLGWVVQTYNATEALANLIHPFWMLPLVGILGLKARDIVGYSMLQFVVHVPLVLFLVWALNYTLTYVPPVLP